jgi:5'-methylthioadenosine phosphorylase
MIGLISGSGFYGIEGFEERFVETRYGAVTLLCGEVGGKKVLLLPRHGKDHEYLPNHLNHRANLLALKQEGATIILSTSVCGLVRPDWSLGEPMLGTDLLFEENRLPGGEICTIFDQPRERGRGHLIAGSFFDSELNTMIRQIWEKEHPIIREGCYVHANGPRFNSKAEIKSMRSAGGDFISQTCGPEAILANELELPYALAAFSIDYANGVTQEPTPMEELTSNLKKGSLFFQRLLETLPPEIAKVSFKNFVYRF